MNENAEPTPAIVPARGFGEEFARLWRELPDKTLFFVLLAAWLLLFQFLGNSNFGYVDTSSLMGWMANAYEHGDHSDEHGFLIPPLVLVLLWWKRSELLASRPRLWLPGLLLLAAALVLHLAGYLVQQQRVSVVALFLGIYALMGLVWGPGWLRASFFPYFLFVFCVPIATIAEPVTFPLRMLVCKLVTILTPVLGIDIVREGTVLYNSAHTYQYEVAAACSGLRSVVAILCISTVYAFLTFDRHWKRLLLMASAFPLAVVGNVLRMMLIIVTAEVFGQSTGDFVHENWFFSLVPYVPAILGVVFLGAWLRGHPEEPVLRLETKPV